MLIFYYLVIFLICSIIVLTKKKKLLRYDENFQIDFPLSQGLYAHNSSIIKENGKYILYSRISNFTSCTIYDRLKYKQDKRINMLGISELDKNFNIISQNILNTNHGLEDLRAFFWNGKKYFIGSNYNINNLDIFYPILLNENFNKIDILDENGQKYIKNKNFAPININNELFFVKNHNPLEILKTDNIDNIDKENKKYIKTSIHFKKEKDDSMLELRGNTPYIDIGNYRFLAVTHDVIVNDWFNKKYRHYFTIINFQDINKPFIEKNSSSFCLLGNCGIEFIMGFIESYDKKSYIITLGKNDCTSHIVTINKSFINEYFNFNS